MAQPIDSTVLEKERELLRALLAQAQQIELINAESQAQLDKEIQGARSANDKADTAIKSVLNFTEPKIAAVMQEARYQIIKVNRPTTTNVEKSSDPQASLRQSIADMHTLADQTMRELAELDEVRKRLEERHRMLKTMGIIGALGVLAGVVYVFFWIR